MIAVAWAISYNRKLFPWRTVIWGIGLQFTLALLILKTPWGAELFEFAGKVVQKLIQFSTDGTQIRFRPAGGRGFARQKNLARNTVDFCHSRHRHRRHRGVAFVAVLSLGNFAARRARRRVGDAQGDAAPAAAKRFPPPRTFSWAKPRRRSSSGLTCRA